MIIKMQRLSDDAKLPFKAHPSDAGFDLTAISVEEDRKRSIVTYHTGLAFEIPDGYVGLLFPRSSVYKHQLSLANSVGVIDSGYRGEVMFKYRIMQPHISRFSIGDKIGQIIIIPYPEIDFKEVSLLGQSDRGDGGFGSSGR